MIKPKHLPSNDFRVIGLGSKIQIGTEFLASTHPGCDDLHVRDANPRWHLVEMTLIKAGTQYVLCCGLESADERLALTEMAPGIL